jgi:hypothetical protein
MVLRVFRQTTGPYSFVPNSRVLRTLNLPPVCDGRFRLPSAVAPKNRLEIARGDGETNTSINGGFQPFP